MTLPFPPVPSRVESPSLKVLSKLEFDPIANLVNLHKKLEKELELCERERTGSLIRILPSGREGRYSSRYHSEVYDKLIKINEGLLDFRYSRLPKVIEAEIPQARPAFTINLTQDGDVFEMKHE